MTKVVQAYGPYVVRAQEQGIPYPQLAKELGCSVTTIWRVRKALGLPTNGKPGSPRKNRSDWDWSLKDIELASIHGISRQRVSVLRKHYTLAKAAAKLTAPNGNNSQDGMAGGSAECSENQTVQDPASAQDDSSDSPQASPA